MAELDGNANQALLKVEKTVTVTHYSFKEKLAAYACNNCKTNYVIEEKHHQYCPFCGIKHTIIINALVDK